MPGAKIVDICQQGDKLLEEELAKVYRGKKIVKGEYQAYSQLSLCSAARWLMMYQRFLSPDHCFPFVLRDPLHSPHHR